MSRPLADVLQENERLVHDAGKWAEAATMAEGKVFRLERELAARDAALERIGAENFQKGMEEAAKLVDEEAHSANELCAEARRVMAPHSALQGYAEQVTTLAKSIRFFAADAEWCETHTFMLYRIQISDVIIVQAESAEAALRSLPRHLRDEYGDNGFKGEALVEPLRRRDASNERRKGGAMNPRLAALMLAGIVAVAEKNTPECPDCGRRKARNADDCANGWCPKWYAIRDPEAKADCEAVADGYAQGVTPKEGK